MNNDSLIYIGCHFDSFYRLYHCTIVLNKIIKKSAHSEPIFLCEIIQLMFQLNEEQTRNLKVSYADFFGQHLNVDF